MSERDSAQHDRPDQLDRRTAVRRAATVVGLGAGALALPGLTRSAEAKPGDAVRAGATVEAGDGQTAIQSSGTDATLRTENTRSSSGPAGDAVDLIGPQVQLGGPVPSGSRPQLPDLRLVGAGTLAGSGGVVVYGAEIGTDAPLPAQVHTSAVGNLMRPVDYTLGAVFDSATLTPEVRGSFPQGSFDAAGRLVAGVRIGVDLRALIDTRKFPTAAAASVSITVSAADTSGTLSAHRDASRAGAVPVVSFTVIPAEATATGQPFAIAATGGGVLPLDRDDKLWVSSSATAHVRVQVAAVVVPEAACLVEPAKPADGLSAQQKRRALQRQATRELLATYPDPDVD
ncbi:hypothetical protein EK0264_03405 [Epidermidibacterium keratini]|uniref:Uncharacterized protein n=1 Tax=Epidermidibacterium keratini TaxID=1891644 RepID=A0A7L4YK08_9ACTN|nr:hypothetical protein [Epidermidibacterium keratini]QHB99421.1 hypothetical protein EK0264_03405 [Epidermidibacterium keratini]